MDGPRTGRGQSSTSTEYKYEGWFLPSDFARALGSTHRALVANSEGKKLASAPPDFVGLPAEAYFLRYPTLALRCRRQAFQVRRADEQEVLGSWLRASELAVWWHVPIRTRRGRCHGAYHTRPRAEAAKALGGMSLK